MFAIFFYSGLTLTSYFCDKNLRLKSEGNTTAHVLLQNSSRKDFLYYSFQVQP